MKYVPGLVASLCIATGCLAAPPVVKVRLWDQHRPAVERMAPHGCFAYVYVNPDAVPPSSDPDNSLTGNGNNDDWHHCRITWEVSKEVSPGV